MYSVYCFVPFQNHSGEACDLVLGVRCAVYPEPDHLYLRSCAFPVDHPLCPYFLLHTMWVFLQPVPVVDSNESKVNC